MALRLFRYPPSLLAAAADAPVDIAAAIAHCNAFPIKEFAPR